MPRAHENERSARWVTALIESSLGSLVEILAAALVALEIVVLFGGVVSRYVFDHPLVWSDELASILFLWLSMLGAVIALRRGEHMRMTALVRRFGPRSLALPASLLFQALVRLPPGDCAGEEGDLVARGWENSSAWRAAALPVGIGL